MRISNFLALSLSLSLFPCLYFAFFLVLSTRAAGQPAGSPAGIVKLFIRSRRVPSLAPPPPAVPKSPHPDLFVVMIGSIHAATMAHSNVDSRLRNHKRKKSWGRTKRGRERMVQWPERKLDKTKFQWNRSSVEQYDNYIITVFLSRATFNNISA